MAFTYFFRDLHTLELTVKHVVPYVAGRSRVRIWDAGCSTGPEPFSLAIMLSEKMGGFAFRNLHIEATDIDGSDLFGNIITAGVYPEGDLKRIPRGIVEKYFLPLGSGAYRIVDLIRTKVIYRKHDLLSLQPVGDGFSLIVCKNVLLHFLPEDRVKVIKMFHAALAPGGYFAMEQTQRLPHEVADLFDRVAADAQLLKKVG